MFTVRPIAYVSNQRQTIEDDYWGNVQSVIELTNEFDEECLAGIEEFSHLEVIFYFDRVKDDAIQYKARHPRNNPHYPKVGIFAQRAKNRPNKLGLTTVKLIKRQGKKLYVQGLDAIDGTPVLDIKPTMKEFLPPEEVKQPAWTTDIMKHYWK
ncbi:tRNA (N6-threonylcarbamoyladenosine(37)-N6)-methyltransferase TrmO [Anoxybacteroides tepidamans]|uniref:tRNA (N6-threonylcarbamoyladenosine(37)-N6)-methyltransferase TrmO n=1 Tax=Anoxybacteroides tepidamans TaxID=265948 RepID=UPI000481CEEE|nr:tRNA (N6-threonylcarbamoyladenosine(37)-N6)-methyltransferase TrmO [Anoxybacillus tepidamans]